MLVGMSDTSHCGWLLVVWGEPDSIGAQPNTHPPTSCVPAAVSVAVSVCKQEVYGFSMAPVASELSRSAASEAKVLVRPVEADALMTDSQQVCGGGDWAVSLAAAGAATSCHDWPRGAVALPN